MRTLGQRGQASIEYLIVGLVLMIVFTALAALSGLIGDGSFVTHAADSASHSATDNLAGTLGDVLLY